MINRYIKKPFLYEEVIDTILLSIKRGEVLPGERFPPERELEKRWNVSRNVLREAFHILESRGLIVSIQGKGRFLRKLPSTDLQDKDIITKLEKSSLLEIYELRKILEVNCLDLAAQRATLEDIRDMKKKYKKMVNSLSDNYVRYDDFKLHLCYAKASHNHMLEQTIAIVLKLITEFRSPSINELVIKHNAEDYILEHGRIIKSIKEKNAEEAKRVILNHIDKTMEKIKFV